MSEKKNSMRKTNFKMPYKSRMEEQRTCYDMYINSNTLGYDYRGAKTPKAALGGSNVYIGP